MEKQQARKFAREFMEELGEKRGLYKRASGKAPVAILAPIKVATTDKPNTIASWKITVADYGMILLLLLLLLATFVGKLYVKYTLIQEFGFWKGLLIGITYPLVFSLVGYLLLLDKDFFKRIWRRGKQL